jgi:miniconductance mechanosensitive channel
MLAPLIAQAPSDSSETGLSTVLEWLSQNQLAAQALAILLVSILAWAADKATKRILLSSVGSVVQRTAAQWDDMLLKHRVFERLAHLAPALAVYYGIQLVPGLGPAFVELVQSLALALMVVIAVLATGALLSAANDIYSSSRIADGRPIKGYVQVAKIVIYLIGGILAISAITGQNPLYMLSGIGAMTAVLLIVFRDTILSFVASLQIASYDMMRVGDWIEMPQFGADGDVVDIGLHTIKVQNWDKTIVAVPTHRFLSDSFKNWRSMPESGGRRIKRAIYIDMNSIRFLEEEDIERFKKFVLLREYIEEKQQELDRYNAERAAGTSLVANARRLTNIGTFRTYVVQYLRQHPKIHDQLTLMVRQLDPTPNGVPLQVYAFSNDVDWVPYEGIQSDIFDHVMAIIPEFGLRLYQNPSGRDFEAALRGQQPAISDQQSADGGQLRADS